MELKQKYKIGDYVRYQDKVCGVIAGVEIINSREVYFIKIKYSGDYSIIATEPQDITELISNKYKERSIKELCKICKSRDFGLCLDCPLEFNKRREKFIDQVYIGDTILHKHKKFIVFGMYGFSDTWRLDNYFPIGKLNTVDKYNISPTYSGEIETSLDYENLIYLCREEKYKDSLFKLDKREFYTHLKYKDINTFSTGKITHEPKRLDSEISVKDLCKICVYQDSFECKNCSVLVSRENLACM